LLVGSLRPRLDEIERQRAPDIITIAVVLPEFIARHWLWSNCSTTSDAFGLKVAPLFRPGTVVIRVPYHLERTLPTDRSMYWHRLACISDDGNKDAAAMQHVLRVVCSRNLMADGMREGEMSFPTDSVRSRKM